jgi:proliferating cell nuclear antigen PCNA
MNLSITEKKKKDIFISIFERLKTCASLVKVLFQKDAFYIQGMDKSHICLFDVTLTSSWFNEYNVEEDVSICFDTQIFFNVLSTSQEHNIRMYCDEKEPDHFHIDLKTTSDNSTHFDKFFKIPLAELDMDQLTIPSVEYDVEIALPSKKIMELCSQLALFGNVIHLSCSEEKVDISTSGTVGEMLVNIPIDDLTEYSIAEGESFKLSYSLSYFHKMCLTTKLSNDIQISLSGSYPMRVKYDLGEDSLFLFFIAPKVDED